MRKLRWILKDLMDAPRDLYRLVKRVIQRGKRGWSDEDTWGLDYHLAPVIRDSVTFLRNNHHGHPADLTDQQWIETLSEIIYTFDTATKILNDEWVGLQNIKGWKWALHEEHVQRLSKNFHVMTYEETKRYEKGWRLFQKYFFNLWD